MRGLTLIELLISISIIVLVVGIGIASLRRNAKSQVLQSEAQKLLSLLRNAQASAFSGTKPASGCNTLAGYEFQFAVDSVSNLSYLEQRPSCTGTSPTPSFSRNYFPSSVSVKTNPTSTLIFKVLSQGVSPDMRICLCDGNAKKKYDVVIKKTGEIQDLGSMTVDCKTTFVCANP